MRWNIDQTHSTVEFGVKHLGIATVKGRFRKFDGFIEVNDAGLPVSLDVSIDAASIDTNQADRDTHLRSPDFFDVERFPSLTFRSSSVKRLAEHEYEVAGQLTMRGNARPVTFRAETQPVVKSPWGDHRRAGVASGKLNRKEWGLVWNQILEAGGLAVGEDVRFNLEIELIEAPAAEKVAV